ncbi:hypothetical protein GCM10022271_15620 [Corallibacter vietnamensis]|uniref:Secretion system C-terminal sorting domain-containing protein n=1 Tax=Corallibacter vietnamensis TaxID=904130 RepID=A0ABP7H648_9FLAO
MKQTYTLLILFTLIVNAINAQTDLIYHIDSGEGAFTTNLDGTSKNLLASYTPSSSSLANDIEIDANNNKMYVLDQNGKNLIQYDLNGANNTLIYTYPTTPRDIELDLLNGKIYHVMNGEIFTTNLDGTNKNSLITYTPSGTKLLNTIQLDLINNHVYALDVNGDSLTRYDLNGNNSTTIYNYVGGTQYPSDFTIDIANNKIYHISRDNTAAEIFTTDLSGNTKTVLTTYTAGASLLYIDIELDVENNYMYLLSDNGDLLDRYNLNGSNKTTVHNYTGNFPKDIEIFKFESTLSLNDTNLNQNKIAIFPNPASNVIQVSGINEGKKAYAIYNALGAKLKNGTIQENNTINIQNLSNGIYFLMFENGNSLKFIKE